MAKSRRRNLGGRASHGQTARARDPLVMATIFFVTNFDQLNSISLPSPDAHLVVGAPFKITMKLNAPVAPLFDLGGAELIFGPVMPPGLSLVDVHGEGSSTVVIDCIVTDVQEASQSQDVATHGIWPAVAAIGSFIAAHWFGLSLAAIGITASLGLLVSSIKGESPLANIRDTTEGAAKIAKWVAIGVLGIAVLGSIPQPRRNKSG